MELPKLEEYLGTLENAAYNAHYDLDLSDYPHIALRPNGKGTHPAEEMPNIFGDYKHDDKYFWFEPRMQFPRGLKSNQYTGSYHSHMKDWAEAAKLADYLLESQWEFDAYSEE